MNLYEELKSYIPYNEQEAGDLKVMLEYVTSFDNVYTRDNVFGHITASPWIINDDATKVLMIYHNIYDSWGWCGGHADGDKDLIRVALKEGKEETGVKQLSLLDSHIFAIDVLSVPPHVKNGKFISSHVHLNVTYLCKASESEMLQIKPDENSGVEWIAINDINSKVTEEDMKVVYQKLMDKTYCFLDEKKHELSLR